MLEVDFFVLFKRNNADILALGWPVRQQFFPFLHLLGQNQFFGLHLSEADVLNSPRSWSEIVHRDGGSAQVVAVYLLLPGDSDGQGGHKTALDAHVVDLNFKLRV